MPKMLHQSIGGSITEVRERRVECVYRGGFITTLLIGVAVLSSVALAFMLVGLVQGGLEALPGVVMVGAYLAVVVLVVRYRKRTMGRFVIDGTTGELCRVGSAGEVITTHPLAEARFATAWDPFHRSFVFQHWVLARCGKSTYRLGKGDKDEATAVKKRLEEIRDAWIEEHGASYRD